MPETTPCPFCQTDTLKVIGENAYAFAIYDKFPVTKHNTLILSKCHVVDYFKLSAEEYEAIHELLLRQRKRLQELDETITGFNVGVNIGKDAGQTIFHVHIHLIPRREGDVEDPHGGVIGVIAAKQKY